MKICLVIIFNHRYDQNLEKLREIYGDRFECIRFLMPFYDGKDNDVIPVYECSYQFQGFLIQAYDKLMGTGADYFFFLADDMILNPKVSQDNLIENLNLCEKEVFLYDFVPVNSKDRFHWQHSKYSSRPFLHRATQWKGSIPDRDDAMGLFKRFFEMEYPDSYGNDFFGDASQKDRDDFIERNGGSLVVPYPLARGYSDVFMLSKNVFFDIARTCGVFSAMNLFVEIAIPTAIVLNVEREKTVSIGQTKYTGQAFWEENIEKFENEFELSFGKLMDGWKEEWLFVHPVKLSKWK